MPGEESTSGFPIWIIAIVAILIIAGGAYYYYTNYMQPIDITVTTSEQEDLYGPQLEALNTEIANAQTTGAVETARQKVNTISTEMGDDPMYAKYKPLVEAQLAVLDMIDLDLEYISTADEYADTGIDCSKNYDSLISDMKNAESEWTGARAKVNSYLYDNSTSTAAKLLDKLNTIDYAGMAVFAEMIERDYSENCVPTEQATGYTTPLSKEDALDLVVNDVVKGEDYYVYMIDQPLTSGTKVTIPRPEGDYNITLTENTWLFFLDSEPFAPFGHPTKIVLVSQDTAEYKIYDGFYYPIVDGVSYWSTLDERLNEDNIVYPENPDLNVELAEGTTYDSQYYYDSLAGAAGSGVPAGTAVPFADELCCEGVEKKKYGLVVQGYDEQMFKSDTVNAYNMLTTRGYSNADITYLTAKAGDALSDGQTTIANVAAALNNIANNAKCCDEVFIYLSGHGASVTHWQYKHKTTNATKWITNLGQLPGGVANWEYTGNSGKYHQITLNPQFTTPGADGGTVSHGSAQGGRAWSWEFAAFLDKMDSCYITFMYFSCYSGVAAPTLAGKGRTIITPVGDRPAWGRSTAGFGSYFTNWFIEAKGKAGDASVDKNGDGKVSDKEAFDYAKAKTSADATSKNRTQEGTYTPPEPCRCCHVVCDESDYLCKVVAGDGTDSDKCPKVGDFCGTETVTPPLTHMECSHQECIEVEGEGEDSCQTDEDCEEPEEPECGDGYVTSPEECEYGTYGKNICPEGQYCKPDCMCHDLETSVVCGDGKISSPEEDCDGGNVKTDICPEGYGCYICKCEPIEAFCGDGMINPPEECDHGNTVTNQCPAEGEVCQNCQCIPRDEATHAECVGEVCTEVSGYGEDSCWSNSDCEEPTHSECQNEACVEVEGEGTDECYTDSDCIEEEEPEDDYGICGDEVIDEPWEECEFDDDCYEGEICIECLCYEVPAYCGNGVVDAGEECEDNSDCSEYGVCSKGCTCVYPPSLDCEYICGQMGLPIILGHGYQDADACAAAAEEEPTTCYTTCIKVGFERVDNIAGWDSCCCKKRELFPCDDCPGQNPVCPDCPSGYQ